MEPVTIALIALCVVMLGIIIWLVVRGWSNMSQEMKEQLADKGIELVKFLKAAWSNDGKIDMAELEQIMRYLIAIIAFLAGKSVSAVKLQTGTEELLQDKTEPTE